ncbi:hypothetical protein GQ457_14G017000 [Hibiscus cannabinus]
MDVDHHFLPFSRLTKPSSDPQGFPSPFDNYDFCRSDSPEDKLSWDLRTKLHQNSTRILHGFPHLGTEQGKRTRDVAVKVFSKQEYSEDVIHAFQREVCLMKRLRHPNVLLLMGVVVSAERLYIVTKFILQFNCNFLLEILSKDQEERLITTLRQHKEALGWTIADIKGISPTICMHKILLEDNHKPTVDAQRRLNQAMKDVVRKEILKWLDAGIIYPISDSEWVSPVQCVPKKRGMTVISNEKNELIPTRTVTGWRVCMDYRKLNKATRKDHFPLPFIDQMLDRLAGKQFYCFLDGYSGYNQIAIAPEDQSKTTFTCPYGTFAFRRMPFGLCNAPATFQRCMTSIFSDLNEDCLEIFMDDFSTFGENFDNCLSNLEKVLKRCKETNLVLNWEKCHFMVDEGILLGHKISSKGMEVDKAKIEVRSKLPPPTTVKGIRSFLGHAGFYRRFIGDFSKITKPLCALLEQGRPFEFNEDCTKAFNLLKQNLESAPIVEPPDWTLPFELMCDASDYAVGAILSHRDQGDSTH